MIDIGRKLRQMVLIKNMSCYANVLDVPHKTNTIVFTMLSTSVWAKFDLSSTIITKLSLFGYVIYSWRDAPGWQCASLEK